MFSSPGGVSKMMKATRRSVLAVRRWATRRAMRRAMKSACSGMALGSLSRWPSSTSSTSSRPRMGTVSIMPSSSGMITVVMVSTGDRPWTFSAPDLGFASVHGGHAEHRHVQAPQQVQGGVALAGREGRQLEPLEIGHRVHRGLPVGHEEPFHGLQIGRGFGEQGDQVVPRGQPLGQGAGRGHGLAEMHAAVEKQPHRGPGPVEPGRLPVALQGLVKGLGEQVVEPERRKLHGLLGPGELEAEILPGQEHEQVLDVLRAAVVPVAHGLVPVAGVPQRAHGQHVAHALHGAHHGLHALDSRTRGFLGLRILAALHDAGHGERAHAGQGHGLGRAPHQHDHGVVRVGQGRLQQPRAAPRPAHVEEDEIRAREVSAHLVGGNPLLLDLVRVVHPYREHVPVLPAERTHPVQQHFGQTGVDQAGDTGHAGPPSRTRCTRRRPPDSSVR